MRWRISGDRRDGVNIKNFALVQLVPKDMRSQESINLGLEIIKHKVESCGWNVDLYKFGEKIDKDKYDIIGFNLFYVTQMLNLVPFLKQNNIEVFSEKRGKPLLIAGGQGVQNPKPINKIIDIFTIGDGEENILNIIKNFENDSLKNLLNFDGIYYPKYNNQITFGRVNEIKSDPVIFKKRAMIELNRGCKYRCKFCQYGWTGGKHREKSIELVKQQVNDILDQGVKNINFLSCNIGGYSKIKELLSYCILKNVRLLNTDVRIDEYTEDVAAMLNILKVRTLKVGLESFSEKTRFECGKKITDKQFKKFIETAINNNISNFHFYLIYGLPSEEDYEKWFYYIESVKNRIKNVERNIRLEYSIMNFEPSIFTPYEHEPLIDFVEKHKFLNKYLQLLEKIGNIQDASTKWYKNMHGRLGRKEEPYKITMWLLHGDESINDVLYDLDIKGVGRSINLKVYEKISKYGVFDNL